MRTRELCNGKGWPHGPKTLKTCPKCGERKANTAFRALSVECMKCERICHTCKVRKIGKRDLRCDPCRRGQPEKFVTGVSHQYIAETRVPYETWMRWVKATEADFAAVVEALGQYGLRNPSPDDILEAHTRGNWRKYADLFHAVVLLAHETAHAGRLGTYKLSTESAKHAKRRRAA